MSSVNRRARRGFTLTEMMVASVILSILVLAVMPVLRLSQQGFSSMEARNDMKSEGEAAMNKVGHKLTECKRLFENTAADNAFLAKATFATAAVMSGSHLAAIEETGSISPSTGTFVASSVGNELFFASVVPAADVTALDSGGVSRSVRIDLYVFNAYYLALDQSKKVAGQTRRVLRDWHSAPYADYNQVTALTDATLKNNVAKALVNSKGISYCFNPSTGVATAAFYSINGASGALTLQAAHTIAQSSSSEMIKFNTGLTLGGFRYGVAPDVTANVSHPVPEFGTASGNFPSGFEIVAVGPNSARQVFVRMVMAAEGTFPGTMTSEQVLLTTVRDLW